MENNTFKFHIQNLSYGWCRVLMLINDKEVSCNAGYIGPNPLETLIDACKEFLIDNEDKDHYITWHQEPGLLDFELHLDEMNKLHLDIIDKDEDDETIYEEWHEVVDFHDFVSSVISEGFRVLNAFGLYGYRCSWAGHSDFPLANLLRITGKIKGVQYDGCDSYKSNFSREMECIQEYISNLKITEETAMEKCVIYYESWQIQCCGDPFSVGDKVEWGCLQSKIKNAHGILLDFDEDHHGFATHEITGIVSKITAERSEYPKGQKEVWYDRSDVIRDELQHADGWESELKNDETIDRTFWGYIVELKDVVVKPLVDTE